MKLLPPILLAFNSVTSGLDLIFAFIEEVYGTTHAKAYKAQSSSIESRMHATIHLLRRIKFRQAVTASCRDDLPMREIKDGMAD